MPKPAIPVFACDAETVVAEIRKIHAHPEWCVFQEVADATGGRASRRADAVALNMWPSRGLEIRGFEVKVSRGDLKREFEDPSKAEAVGKYCDTWCLAYPAGLIRPSDNVPLSWGLFEVSAKGGRYVKQPTARIPSMVTPVTRTFMAALARASYEEVHRVLNGGEWIRKKDIEARVQQAFDDGVRTAPERRDEEVLQLRAQVKLLKPLADVLGLDLEKAESWTAEKWKPAMELGLSLFSEFGFDTLDAVTKQIQRSLEQLKEVQASVGKLSYARRIKGTEKGKKK